MFAKTKKSAPEAAPVKAPSDYGNAAVQIATLVEEAKKGLRRLKEIDAEVSALGGSITIRADYCDFNRGMYDDKLRWSIDCQQYIAAKEPA